jgi:lipoprotein-anchoring transpeptidase ErfK/SrfK
VLLASAVAWSGAAWLSDAQPVEAAEFGPADSTPSIDFATQSAVTDAAAAPIVASLQSSASASIQAAVPAAAPPESLTPPPPPAQAPAAKLVWQGLAGQEGYVRAAPTTAAPKVGELRAGQPVRVLRWVGGQEVEKENTTWADLGDGRYVYSALLRSRPVEATPERPANAPTSGRWIDVNLTLQVATAYEGTTPLKSVLVSTGRPGWETPRGTFAVQRRVAKETMDGRTLIGQGPNGAGASYKVENVRWTQYFTADGSAIHENYWRNPALFGMPGSHGCIGMRSADAAWFWDFATTGTPIVIH